MIHVHSCTVQEAFTAMIEYDFENPNSYFFFDVLCLNQHEDGFKESPATMIKKLGSRIKSIGSTLVVASPWNDPAFLGRKWYKKTSAINFVRVFFSLIAFCPFCGKGVFMSS